MRSLFLPPPFSSSSVTCLDGYFFTIIVSTHSRLLLHRSSLQVLLSCTADTASSSYQFCLNPDQKEHLLLLQALNLCMFCLLFLKHSVAENSRKPGPLVGKREKWKILPFQNRSLMNSNTPSIISVCVCVCDKKDIKRNICAILLYIIILGFVFKLKSLFFKLVYITCGVIEFGGTKNVTFVYVYKQLWV